MVGAVQGWETGGDTDHETEHQVVVAGEVSGKKTGGQSECLVEGGQRKIGHAVGVGDQVEVLRVDQPPEQFHRRLNLLPRDDSVARK
jgi:hypothetical protein